MKSITFVTSRAELRAFLRLGAVVAACLVLPIGAGAKTKTETTPTPEPVIATGVTVAGVDLSGLTVAQAAENLEQHLTPHLTRDVRVGAAGRPFRFSATEAGYKFDALKTAKRAYYKGRDNPPDPTAAESGGQAEDFVKPVVSYNPGAVSSFAQSVASKVDKPARNAKIRITVRHIYRKRARRGYAISTASLTSKINAALSDVHASRKIHMRTYKTRAKVNVNDLARVYNTVVTVDRDSFKLRLFKRLKHKKTYIVAVGMAGLATPGGRFRINDKQVDPAWHVPNSSWAGSLAGQTIPGGAPDNPLKARWLGVADGVGIHGTGEEWTVGSRASHGCIRMRVADVKDLYSRVPVGSPVLIR